MMVTPQNNKVFFRRSTKIDTSYFISQLAYALWLVYFIVQPAQFKSLFWSPKCLSKKILKHILRKSKTNKKNETQKQISYTFELVSSRFWRKTSDEWRRQARRRQFDWRARWFHRRRKVVKHKKKKTKKSEYEWKMFEGFANSRQMEILMQWT